VQAVWVTHFTPTAFSSSKTSTVGHQNIWDISNYRSGRLTLHTRGNMYVHGEASSVLHPGKNDRKTVIRHQLPRRSFNGHHVTVDVNTRTHSRWNNRILCLRYELVTTKLSAKYNCWYSSQNTWCFWLLLLNTIPTSKMDWKNQTEITTSLSYFGLKVFTSAMYLSLEGTGVYIFSKATLTMMTVLCIYKF